MLTLNSVYNNYLETDNRRREAGLVTDESDIDFGWIEHPVDAMAYGASHGLAVGARTGLLAASTLAISGDSIRSYFTKEEDTRSQDWFFENVIGKFDKEILSKTNYNTIEKGYLDDVAFGVSDVITRAYLGGVGGLAVSEFAQTATEEIDKGKTVGQATALGAIDAAVMGVGGAQTQIFKSILKSLGKDATLSTAKAVALGAVGNPVINVAGMQAKKAELRSQGYEEEANQLEYTATNFLTDLLIGGAFGALDGTGKFKLPEDGVVGKARPYVETTARDNDALSALGEQLVVSDINPLLKASREEYAKDIRQQDAALSAVVKGEKVSTTVDASPEKIQDYYEGKAERTFGTRDLDSVLSDIVGADNLKELDATDPVGLEAKREFEYDPTVDNALYGDIDPYLEAHGNDIITTESGDMTVREAYDKETKAIDEEESDLVDGITSFVKCLFGKTL